MIFHPFFEFWIQDFQCISLLSYFWFIQKQLAHSHIFINIITIATKGFTTLRFAKALPTTSNQSHATNSDNLNNPKTNARYKLTMSLFASFKYIQKELWAIVQNPV